MTTFHEKHFYMKVGASSGGEPAEMPYSLSHVAALVRPALGSGRALSDRDGVGALRRACILLTGSELSTIPTAVVKDRWQSGHRNDRLAV